MVVVAILAVFVVGGFFIINPSEWSRRNRDIERLTNVENLQLAISAAIRDASGAGNLVLCNGGNYPCIGRSNMDLKNSNGTGWIKVNLDSQQAISFPTLPIDPTNTTAYHYTYCADNPGSIDSWEMDIALESKQYITRMSSDGGNDPSLYETGSNLNLIAASGGSCTF